MDRLTGKHYGRGDYYMVCSGSCANDDEMCGGCPWLEKIINRLGSYEDTGLEPEEIEKAMEDCADTVAKNQFAISDINEMGGVDHLRELIQAEKDGRLVVLPYKVGDFVYLITIKRKYVNHPMHTPYIKVVEIKPENAYKYINKIGKDVFLTRKEAKAALKGCDEK